MQKVRTWEVLEAHPIAKTLDTDTQFALLCEYIDLLDDLKGMSLDDFITAYFTADTDEAPAEAPAEAPKAAPKTRTRTRAKAEPKVAGEAAPAVARDNGDGVKPEPAAEFATKARPASMVGLRVVYRFPGRNILSDETGVTRDSGGFVTFTDVDGEPWSNIARDKVHPIDPHPDYHRVVHIIPREAKLINGWLAGTPSSEHPDGALLRSVFVEFTHCADRIAFAIMNGKKPYVDRFVALPDNGFEDDQKPITRFFGEHCFRVQEKDYIVKVVTP